MRIVESSRPRPPAAPVPRLAALALLTATLACQRHEVPASRLVRVEAVTADERAAAFAIHSPAFSYGGAIPARYTADGLDLAPPLQWDGVPAGTAAFVLIVEHHDVGGEWVHWLVYDIPGDVRALREGSGALVPLPIGSKVGLNSFGVDDYVGPEPPPGAARRYYFTLYALSAPTGVDAGFRAPVILQAIDDRALGRAQWMGVYQR